MQNAKWITKEATKCRCHALVGCLNGERLATYRTIDARMLRCTTSGRICMLPQHVAKRLALTLAFPLTLHSKMLSSQLLREWVGSPHCGVLEFRSCARSHAALCFSRDRKLNRPSSIISEFVRFSFVGEIQRMHANILKCIIHVPTYKYVHTYLHTYIYYGELWN